LVFISFPYIRKPLLPLLLEHEKNKNFGSCQRAAVKQDHKISYLLSYVMQPLRNPPLCSKTNLTYISCYGLSFRNVLAALLKCILSNCTLGKGREGIISAVSQWLRRRVQESWLPAGDSLLPDPVLKQLKAEP
jgi:hypothetical protein